jgi:CHAT domain-containing protein
MRAASLKKFAAALIAIMSSGYANPYSAEAQVGHETFTTKSLTKSRKLRNDFDAQKPHVKEDVREIFHMDAEASSLFKNAAWSLASDGAAALNLIGEHAHITLLGSWSKCGEARCVHLKKTGRYGEKLSFDGLIDARDGRVMSHGIWTVNVGKINRVELLSLALQPAQENTANAEELSLSLARSDLELSKKEAARNLKLLSEPMDRVGGSPVPSNFDISLEVTLDGEKLEPMTGSLLISKSETAPTGGDACAEIDGAAPGTAKPRSDGIENSPEPALDLILTTSGALRPGRSAWSSLDLGTATARNGRVCLNFSPPRQTLAHSWHARNPDRRSDVSAVSPKQVKIDLIVTPDTVEGRISATGEVLDGSHPPSRFEARISGKRSAKDLEDRVVKTLGRRLFDGEWKSLITDDASPDAVYAIKQPDNKEITGAAPGNLIFMGKVKGRIASVQWPESVTKSENGFLTVTDAGLLVGLTWSGAWTEDQSASLQPIAARLGADVPHPSNDNEAFVLRYLAQDMAHAGKHGPAVELMKSVIEYYEKQEKLASNDSDPSYQAEYGHIINQVTPLNTLIDSSFRYGDYDKFIWGLHRALKSRNKLRQSSVVEINLKEQKRLYHNTLKSSASTLRLLAEAFKRSLIVATKGGIGAGLEQVPGGQGLRITALAQGMPAIAGGVEVGDVVMKIDGAATDQMQLDDAIGRLTGAPGSSVKIVVMRNGAPIEILLTRKWLAQLNQDQRKDLSSAMPRLRKLAILEAEKLTVEAADVRKYNNFATFLRRISIRRKELQETQELVIKAARDGLDKAPEYQTYFDRFRVLSAAPEQHIDEIWKIDRKIDDLKRDPNAPAAYVSFTELSMGVFGILYKAEGALAGRERNAAYVYQTSQNRDLPPEVARAMQTLESRLVRWRARLGTDHAKLEALDKNTSKAFYSDYVRLLAEFSLEQSRIASKRLSVKCDSKPSQMVEFTQAQALAEQSLIASEQARERTLADLIASRAADARSSANEPEGLRSLKTAPPLTIDQILNLSNEMKSTILEYFLTDEYLYIWAVLPPSPLPEDVQQLRVRLFRTDIDEGNLKKKVNQLIDRIEQRSQHLMPDSETSISSLLSELYDKLIKPVEPLLPKDPEQPIVIIPHGYLAHVPFVALKPSVHQLGRRPNHHLIEDHTITYAPSLGVLHLLRKTNGKTKTLLPEESSLLVVVNPEFGTELKNRYNESLKQLPLLEMGANILDEFYVKGPIEKLSGKNATRKAVLERAHLYDALLFLTHAEVDETDPYNSYVALAGERLLINDIGKRRLKNPVVYFIACQTGRGEQKGDSLMGLSRMTFAAGAQSIFASLWTVPEEETMQLIYDFHKIWRQKKSMTAAFREAQLRSLGRNPEHIRLWAGLNLFAGRQ